MDTTYTLVNALTFNAAAVLKGQVVRLVTFVFIPDQAAYGCFVPLFLLLRWQHLWSANGVRAGSRSIT